MDDNKIERAVIDAGLTAPRVTQEQINRLHSTIIYVESQPEGSTSTFCHAYLPGIGGKMFFLATGHSACVSPENFNAQIGKDIAYSKAVSAAKEVLWQIEGYALFKELNRE